MNYFPMFFALEGEKVLVVGGGEVALRKVALLERCGAAVTVVAPQVAPELMHRAARGSVRVHVREFQPADLEEVRLVIVATSHPALNRWIANLCDARALPVNVVDDRDASRFIVPAVIDRDPVIIAVSTGGASPVLARRLRERLETVIPKTFGELALWLRHLRAATRRRLRSTDERRRFFEALVDGPAARRFVAGDRRGAERIAQQLLSRSASAAPQSAGEVILVGAGPGDPELLTLKALRALQDADIILHDRLVPDAILDFARRDAARICVGKAAGGPATSQQTINDLMIEHARLGRRVVRLKGGDPFIFGRGGEELEALARAGISFSVVPGITAAAGAAAYAGIPLTHRDHAHSVIFVTGHDGRRHPAHEPHWAALSAPRTTAVFYMGLAKLPYIVAQLLAHGASAQRPAALIARGTLADQKVVAATLATIVDSGASAAIEAPALFVVGEVVGLQSALAWFHASAPVDWIQTA